MEKVEEAFFEKLGQAMEYSQDSLLEVMQEYDFERGGTIDAKDLPKVIKKLGIMNPEPHIPAVLRAGRCLPQDKRIDYADFSRYLEAEIAKRKKKAASVAQRQMEKVSAILKVKEMSLFEFFVMVDVNQSGTASRLEFKTGVQQLGLTASAEELDSLWTAVRPATSQVPHQSTQRAKIRGGRTKNRLEPGVEQVAYLKVLKAFAAAGCLKL
jgi:Ca2+-binding EF-hand superfamily protein